MSQKFSDLGVAPKLLDVLDQLNFVTPTPIQEQAIPVALTGVDVIGIAQTGTGKTLAFSLPMLQRIAKDKTQGLIILPTRELAIQVQEELNKIGNRFGLKTALLIGGDSVHKQVGQIKNRPHIFVGTPGRINDHLEQKNLKLGNVGVLVLDEADRMLDMGFEPQIRSIVSRVPRERQTMLFSATMPQEIMRLVNQYMKKATRVEASVVGSVNDRVAQELYVIDQKQKSRLLDKLLADHEGTVLVFSRTKYGAKKVCRAVRGMGHQAAEMHSNLSSSQRKRALEGFKSGQYRVLVATDIAARGLDVTDIELVINYDLPDNSEDYVHRVGRTGRAGKQGKAISFACPDQKKEVYGIERSVQQPLAVSPLPELPPMRQLPSRNYQAQRTNYNNKRSRTTFSYDKKRNRSGHGRSRQYAGSRSRRGRVHA